jgi:hypothetical protein
MTVVPDSAAPALVRDHLGRLAFASARVSVFLSLRLPLYFYNLVAPDGWGQGRPLVVGGTLGAACIDALLAWRMRKRGRPLLWLRIPLDLVYVCLAAIAVPPTWPYSGVLLILVPTAIELIAVRGVPIGGLFVSAAGVDMYFARTWTAGKPYTFELIFYGTWVLVVGTVAFAVVELVGQQHQRRFLSERQAFKNFVSLQTRNELLLGRGGAVAEALNRTWYQMHMTVGRAASAASEEFRQQQERLSAETRSQARYLVDILTEFAAAQRRNRPTVSEHLHLRMEREERLQVLTPGQAAALAVQLSELNLTGQHAVRVVASDHITGELSLALGGHSLDIPPARGRRVVLVPAAVIFGSGSLLALSDPTYADLPIFPVLLAVVCTALMGLTAELRRRRGAKWGLHYLWLSTMTPALITILMTVFLPVHWRLANGRIIMPALVGLTASFYMIGIIWLELSWRIRLITIFACAAWLLAAVKLNPFGAPPLWSIIGNLAIPASVVFAVLSFEDKNHDLGLRLHDQWVAALQRRADEIRRRAVDYEIEGLQRQIDAATRMAKDASDGQDMQSILKCVAEAEFHLGVIRHGGERNDGR